MSFDEKVSNIAKNIKLLVLDVDGVLTDGGIYFDDKGTEHKKFNSQDVGLTKSKSIFLNSTC